MDPQLYNAAESGNWDVIKEFESQLNTELTPERNTVLHVLSRFCDSSFAVEQILQRQPELLQKTNAKGETALHIAASKGHLNVVRALVVRAKHSEEKLWSHMVSSQSKNGNFPLHEAVQNNHIDIVKLLVQEDPTVIQKTNNANESPLYIAVEKGNHSLTAVMFSCLDLEKSPSSEILENSEVLQTGDGPDMKSLLHAAAIQNCKDCTQVILDKLPQIIKEVDKFGWTPLHYAAKFNLLEVAKQLLNVDGSMADVKYKRDVHSGAFEEQTALHVAVVQGHLHMVEEILSSNPNCWEIVTDQGKNAIHLAVENEQKQVLDFILGKSWASKLINQKDIDGNTPLHLYAATRNLLGSNLANHPAVAKNVVNNAGLTALDLIKDAADQIRRRQSELENAAANVISGEETKLGNTELSETEPFHVEKKTFDAQVVVAALVLTVSYAAAFTLPGGFDTNDDPKKGLAILAKKSAFVTYIVCVNIGMICSWFPLGMVAVGELKYQDRDDVESFFGYILLGVLALLIAFVAGLYVAVPITGIRVFIIVLIVVSGFAFVMHIPE